MNEPETIREMLGVKTIAVLGLSDRAERPSHYVSAYLRERGYAILPVNPALANVLGLACVATLGDLPERPDLVNVFRAASFLPGIVDEMLALGLTRLWAQPGIVDPETAARAEAIGIRVVMDRCIMVEHRRLSAER